jgi:hypothetical protein
MRWIYKTVHYELKKEGFLGSAFLDESEIEISLNEYGKAGWELVSLLETMDGLTAVFKQPLGIENTSFAPDLSTPVSKMASRKRQGSDAGEQIIESIDSEISYGGHGKDVHYGERRQKINEPVVEEKHRREENKTDVGTIRIE